MDLSSSSWSIWLHLFSFHFYFAANFHVVKKDDGLWQQIFDETVKPVCINYLVSLFCSSIDGLPGGVQQSGNFYNPSQRPPSVRHTHHTESVSTKPPSFLQ